MNQKAAIEGCAGANSFARATGYVRMNSHLQKQSVGRMQQSQIIHCPASLTWSCHSAALSAVCACVTRAGLAIIEFLHSHFQRIMLWLSASSRPHYRRKLAQSVDRHNHRHSSQKPEWLKDEIIRLKALMPQAGCRRKAPLSNFPPQAGERANESLREFHVTADICNRRFAASRKVTVGKTYVHQVLQRHDYEIQILRRNLKHAKPKPVPHNLIWGIDLTGKTDTRGSLHFFFGILDHGSRALLHLQALHDKTSRTLIACISEVIRTHGKPKIIRTDNEAVFTSRIFRRGLKMLGIRHQLTDPGCPWQNGRIERLFGTLKQKLDQWQMANFAQLNYDLQIFCYWYNHLRPHQNLNGKTPAEVWKGVSPYAKPPKQEQWFEAWDGLLAGYCLRY